MPEYQEIMIKLSQFDFLFKNMNKNINSIPKLLELLGEEVNTIKMKMKKLLTGLENQQLLIA